MIEEAPAPGMTAKMREAMGQAGVRAAEAIGYKGAGTVEFIVDGSGRAAPRWVLVHGDEHPPAGGASGDRGSSPGSIWWNGSCGSLRRREALPAKQDDLTITGHAFEARLYAEDVPKGFLPATGTLTHLSFPAECRADSGVRAGDTISPWYDPMISKVIVHGSTRKVALSRLARALEETEVGGTVTNLAFLGALAAHEGFANGEVDTGLIARDLDALTAAPVVELRHKAAAGMVALDLVEAAPDTGFTLWAPLHRAVTLSHAGEEFTADVQVDGPDRQLWTVDGETVVAERSQGQWRIDERRMPAVSQSGPLITVHDAYGLEFTAIDPLDRDAAAGGDSNVIEAPMPGLVKAVFAEAGQAVKEGDRLAILEAMKMEHSLLAARDGVVAEVLAAAGDQVEAGAALVRLKDEDG